MRERPALVSLTPAAPGRHSDRDITDQNVYETTCRETQTDQKMHYPTVLRSSGRSGYSRTHHFRIVSTHVVPDTALTSRWMAE